MKIIKIMLMLSLGFLFFQTSFAEESTPAAENGSETRVIEAKRGNTISLKDLGLIANLSSARDEHGKTVTLSGDNYTIGAYSSSTISVVLKGTNDAESLITLDLLKKPGEPAPEQGKE